MSRFPRRFAAATAVAGALTLSGCGALQEPAPAPVPPVRVAEPTRPPTETFDYRSCWSGRQLATLAERACMQQGQQRANAANAKAAAEYAAKFEKYSAWYDADRQYQRDLAAYRAAPPTVQKPWVAGITSVPFLAGLAALLAGGYSAGRRRDPLADLPPHRAPDGPAAGVRTTAAQWSATAGWLGVVAAPALMLLGFGAAGPAVLAVVVGGLIAWGVVARLRWLGVAKAGYEIAGERWERESEAAGTLLPEPQLDSAEAHALGLTQGFEAPAGSAAEVMLGIDGKDAPVRAAWLRVAQALKLGDTDEQGSFTPFATISGVQLHENGDVEVTWDLRGAGRTEADMSRAAGPLLRELRVKGIAGGFRRNVSTGQVVATFSNGGSAGPAAGPAAAAPADDWDF